MLKALENFDKLGEEEKFRNWLFTIITNTYISYYRKKMFLKILSIDEFGDTDKMPDIFPRTQITDIYDDIYIALSGLKKKEKIALLLFEIGGFSVEEIKSIQKEKSSSAIKSRLSRAREKLKTTIKMLETGNPRKLVLNFKTKDDLLKETEKIITKIKPENQGG